MHHGLAATPRPGFNLRTVDPRCAGAELRFTNGLSLLANFDGEFSGNTEV